MSFNNHLEANSNNGIIGSWHVIIETSQGQDVTAWESLRKLHVEAPHLFCKPPTRKSKESSPSTLISCYTSSCDDQTIIKQSAEFIRQRIHLPYSIHLFSFELNQVVPQQNNLRFMHTPEGELYKYTDHGWEVVDLDPSANFSTPNIMPSEVFDEECIFFPSSEEGVAKMKDEKGGKWMVFSNSMARHDACWLALVPLYKKGILTGLKASTSVLVSNLSPGYTKTDPVILCYTADAEDREDVLRAAAAIRKALRNKFMLFYKTNSASNSGLYRRDGKTQVTKFKHSVQGGLYERDFLKRYKLVIPSS